MKINSGAGKPADPSILVNVPKLITDYYELRPDPSDTRQRVVFGTSGHRGSATDVAFNEWHILANTQSICDLPQTPEYRRTTFPWDGHPRSIRARISKRSGSACGKQGRSDALRRHRVHPDPRGFPFDSRLQPR